MIKDRSYQNNRSILILLYFSPRKPPLPQPTAAAAAAAVTVAPSSAPPVPRITTSNVMIQTSPRILESPRLDLSVALTGAGLDWLFGSKWQWFAASKGEGTQECDVRDIAGGWLNERAENVVVRMCCGCLFLFADFVSGVCTQELCTCAPMAP